MKGNPLKHLPTTDLGRHISLAEIARTGEVPVETVITWHRLLLAMGFEMGLKMRGRWNFSPHEYYQFCIAASLSKAGHPVGIDTLRQIIDATKDEGRPSSSLFLKTKSAFAIVAVDVAGLWDVLAHMLERLADAQAH